jgi:hypothetical protein
MQRGLEIMKGREFHEVVAALARIYRRQHRRGQNRKIISGKDGRKSKSMTSGAKPIAAFARRS